ncbi:unnamed protein product, partial [Allacma fusca]
EEEKARRWQEIRIRQNRLRHSGIHRGNPMEQSMLKSGFTMSDIKELQRGYSEDVVESDDMMLTDSHDDRSRGLKRGKSTKVPPTKPARSGSISRQLQYDQSTGATLDTTKLPRASSEMQLNRSKKDHALTPDPEAKEEKKKSRGKSPFRFFSRKREESKERAKASSRTPEPDAVEDRNRQNQLNVRNAAVRLSQARLDLFKIPLEFHSSPLLAIHFIAPLHI